MQTFNTEKLFSYVRRSSVIRRSILVTGLHVHAPGGRHRNTTPVITSVTVAVALSLIGIGSMMTWGRCPVAGVTCWRAILFTDWRAMASYRGWWWSHLLADGDSRTNRSPRSAPTKSTVSAAIQYRRDLGGRKDETRPFCPLPTRTKTTDAITVSPSTGINDGRNGLGTGAHTLPNSIDKHHAIWSRRGALTIVVVNYRRNSIRSAIFTVMSVFSVYAKALSVPCWIEHRHHWKASHVNNSRSMVIVVHVCDM